MNALIDAAFSRTRIVSLVFVVIGLKQMFGNASEGHASVQLEFEPGFDADEALLKVREAVDRAEADLPSDADAPTVTEINTALFPILTAVMSGPVPERTLNRLTNDLKEDLEGLPGILEVDVGGERTELLEVLIDPTVFETYNISFDELIGQITRNNLLIAAGAIETGAGRLVVKVPGLIEDVNDVMELPVKVRGDTVVWALGVRSALLVGLAIPGAFLAGVTALLAMGFTMNIVVLFSLILVVGMLVDGAIVTTELADRKLQEGEPPKVAYAYAAKRMSWPIIASTATTLSVFFPLLFWEGTVGEFMKFLPITVIMTLGASLFMALVFIPVIGGIIGKRPPQSAKSKAALHAAESGDPRDMTGFTGRYVRLLQWAILRPGTTVLFALAILLGSFGLYGQLGNGVTFFPSVEPDFMQVEVRARDNFSIYERDALVRRVEEKLLNYDEIKSVYAKSFSDPGDEEVVGTLQLELQDWDTRRKAVEIGEDIRRDVVDIAGIDVQVQTESDGPAGGKPVGLEVVSNDNVAQVQAVEQILAEMTRIGGFTDVTDTRALPGVEWRIQVDRSEAARFGADIALLGQAIRLLTQGITVADYRPDDADGSVDIRVRFPSKDRTLGDLQGLRVPTSSGLVPISNFVTFEPSPRTGTLEAIEFPNSVAYSFGGEAEDQAEAMVFLIGAFLTAIGMMFAILVTQFNSFYQAFVVMSAIVFSVAGVLLGLLVTGRPFGIVMGGIGVIALAGIVVNNNIVLIDTYNDLKRSGMSPLEAVLRTGAQRLRPVVLTSVTTALGLMPMVIGLNINFYTREIVYGAPSTQWWTVSWGRFSEQMAHSVRWTKALCLWITRLFQQPSPGSFTMRPRRLV